jgi:FtsZ-interacting cell division protein ZipA
MTIYNIIVTLVSLVAVIFFGIGIYKESKSSMKRLNESFQHKLEKEQRQSAKKESKQGVASTTNKGQEQDFI